MIDRETSPKNGHNVTESDIGGVTFMPQSPPITVGGAHDIVKKVNTFITLFKSLLDRSMSPSIFAWNLVKANSIMLIDLCISLIYILSRVSNIYVFMLVSS